MRRHLVLQGVMSPSPSGALGDQHYRQLSMGRMPSMGMGKLESMELPDAVAAVAMLHDMPAEQQRGGANAGNSGGGAATAGGSGSPAEAAKQPQAEGTELPVSNGLAAQAGQVHRALVVGTRCLATAGADHQHYAMCRQSLTFKRANSWLPVTQGDGDRAEVHGKREAPEAPDNPEQALMDQV
jgi:hypothetical protein